MMTEDTDLIALTVDVVAAFVGHNNIRPEDLPGFIASTHAAIRGLDSGAAASSDQTNEEEYKPAVSARKSLGSKDHIISMIDGKPYKTLRRHLATHGLTPETYRARYKLPATYPMVAESYSATRRDLARKIGLGRKVNAKPAAAIESGAPAVPARKRAPAARKPRAPKEQVEG